MKKKLTAREYAVKTCSLSAQTKKTLSLRLKKKGYSDTDIGLAVEAMEENGYINEKEYAEAFVSDSYRLKKHGAKRIVNELILRGIKSESAYKAVEKYGADECEIIRSVMQKRFDETDDSNKIFRFFLSRGFEADDIRKCINE